MKNVPFKKMLSYSKEKTTMVTSPTGQKTTGCSRPQSVCKPSKAMDTDKIAIRRQNGLAIQ
jgi:hypothetical protein